MVKGNRHRGSGFDEFLREQRLYDDVQAVALKRAISEAVEEGMLRANLSKAEMARRMNTSRSQLERVLDPACTTVQLDTLIRAASAVGQELRIGLKRVARKDDPHPRPLSQGRGEPSRMNDNERNSNV
jgi:antitoxin HicB